VRKPAKARCCKKEVFFFEKRSKKLLLLKTPAKPLIQEPTMPLCRLLAIAIALWPAMASAAQPPALVAVLRDFVRAASGSDGRAFAALFEADCSITDTVKPYHWQGTGTAAHYFADLQDAVKAGGFEGLHLTSNGDPFLVARADHAYASLPLFVDYSLKGTAHREPGIFTLSLHQDGAAWKITSATWTYSKPPS
jgi:hypothetical protein